MCNAKRYAEGGEWIINYYRLKPKIVLNKNEGCFFRQHVPCSKMD